MKEYADIAAILGAANPLPADRAAALAVRGAQQELLAELVRTSRRAPHDAAAPALTAGASTPHERRRAPRLALASAAALVVMTLVLSLGGGSGDRSGTAWAAALVRFAEASPRVLLDQAGWRVTYANEQSAQEGEMRFASGPAPAPAGAPIPAARQTDAPTNAAALNWRGGDLSMWTRDRAASADLSTTARVLGTTAALFEYQGGRPGHQDITALWRYDGRVLEFRAGAADVAAFEALLASLRPVDTNAWLSSLPDSVVKASDRTSTVLSMLRGVTLPPGFDPSTITGATLTKDRYQLGAAVAGSVACTWFKRWSDARAGGDAAGVAQAIRALASAKSWPILAEMSKSGAYPQALEDYAAAMPSGRWYGRPLEGELDSGLGCTELGIRLAAPGAGGPRG